ncbi:MAG: hypothetical protein IJ845_02250 [Bacteroidaceae bacterium]|nr:hypothetical protein [Bacteroidaceae bacterium]
MKKTIFAAVFAFAVIIGGHQYFKNQASDNLSEIMKANVEALALEPNNPNEPIYKYYVHPCPELYKNRCSSIYEEYRPYCYTMSFCN